MEDLYRFTPEELLTHAEHSVLERAIMALQEMQRTLPRCAVDDGGHGPCVLHRGHNGDHGANGWAWGNFGPDGKSCRR